MGSLSRPQTANSGPSTQRDPIGLIGGSNQYGYAGGDPVGYSDPYGERVCFRGSAGSIARQKIATEKATGTAFDLDGDNCAKNVTTVGPATERSEGFRAMVEDPTFTAYISFSMFQPTGGRSVRGTLDVRIDINRFASRFGLYYTHDTGGRCQKTEGTRNSVESLVAHELGHVYNQLVDDNVHPDAAMRWQNQIVLSQGRPLRYDCGDHR